MLTIDDLTVAYPGTAQGARPAVEALALRVQRGRVLSLLGPSGCGKSTTLRAIAGMLRPRRGRIAFGEREFFCAARGVDLPAADRDIGFMFQSYAIWPHMSVLENAAFPLTVARPRLPRARIRETAMEMLDRLELAALAGRRATSLSGGQQQRLALARALVRNPSLLLLDEPLSNVEPGLRGRMTDQLRDLQRETGVTMLVVTHDHDEALALSHEIAVMDHGSVLQTGSPREIYQQPANAFVADFVGKVNLIDVDAVGPAGDDGLHGCASPLGPLRLGPMPRGTRTLAVRPESLTLHARPPAEPPPNLLEATVRAVVFFGDRLEVHVQAGQARLLVRCDNAADLRDGDRVHVECPPEAFTGFDGAGAGRPD